MPILPWFANLQPASASTWRAIAAIARHPDILCTNGAFKVLALGIVPAPVLADQLKPFPPGQACGVLVLACWNTPYIVPGSE
jgi:hypothetical protein